MTYRCRKGFPLQERSGGVFAHRVPLPTTHDPRPTTHDPRRSFTSAGLLLGQAPAAPVVDQPSVRGSTRFPRPCNAPAKVKRRNRLERSRESACKPDSVRASPRRPSIWDLCCHRPHAVYLEHRGRETQLLLDLAPSGVCQAIAVSRDAGGLLHHRFTLTGRISGLGGLFSVALSVGSPRLGVTQHSFPVESGLSSTEPEGLAAAVRRTHPRIVLNDLELGGGNGLSLPG